MFNSKSPHMDYQALGAASLAPYPTSIHFVGSVPLPSTKETLTRLSQALPNHLRRLPDGEPGLRQTFSGWQKSTFLPSPYLMREHDLVETTLPPNAQETPPAAGEPVNLGPLHYDTEAIKSYIEFTALRAAGTIPAGTRFQVSIPTPASLYTRWVTSDWVAAVEAPYEARLIEALAHIQDAIPHNDLAIQWDAPIEFAMLEGVDGPMGAFKPWFGEVLPDGKRDVFLEIVERLARYGSQVEPDVQLGYHFCYGDQGHKHFLEPKDTALMVRVANAVMAKTKRNVDWIHMPVPKDRTDEAYFEPLQDLDLQNNPDLELCVGLVHAWDVDGTRKRIEIARKLAPPHFAIATECGLGRADVQELDEVLSVCRQVLW